MTEHTTTNYIGGWTIAASAAIAGAILLYGAESFHLQSVLIVGAVVICAELIVVHINLGRAGAVFSLSEAAIVGSLLTAAPLNVIVGAIAAVVLAHLPRRPSVGKALFNASQVAVSTTAAAFVITVLPAIGPAVGRGSLLGGVLAMAAYALSNTLAFRGLMLRVAGDEGRRSFDKQAFLTLASMLGTVAVGIVAAQLWVSQPLLIPLLLVPLIAIQIAARSSIRADELVVTLRDQRDRLEQVVYGASDGILLLDGWGKIQLWNSALERLTGTAASEAIGRPIEDVLTDTVRLATDPVRGRWVMDKPRDRRLRLDAQWHHREGGIRDVQEHHALLFDESGNCNGDVLVVRDVTHERELERLRGDFIARVSHELRTPLTPIRGYVNLLLRKEEAMTREQRSESLHRVLDRADRLSDLIEDLLLVTQLEDDRIESIIQTVPTEIAPIVRRTIQAVSEHSPDRTISITVEPDLPLAVVDANRYRQIVSALIDNAIRYSDSATAVEVTLKAVPSGIELEIADRGSGIPQDQQSRIFEQFQRIDDPMTMSNSGVGLGLYLVKRLTEAMNGTVSVWSQLGKGSRFTVTVPMSRQPHENPQRSNN